MSEESGYWEKHRMKWKCSLGYDGFTDSKTGKKYYPDEDYYKNRRVMRKLCEIINELDDEIQSLKMRELVNMNYLDRVNKLKEIVFDCQKSTQDIIDEAENNAENLCEYYYRGRLSVLKELEEVLWLI